jgi:hypothetical protein
MRAVNDHLDNIVRPALQNYIEAERAPDRANHSKDADDRRRARRGHVDGTHRRH